MPQIRPSSPSIPQALFSAALAALATAGCGGQLEPASGEAEPVEVAAASQHQDANAHQWWSLPAPAWNVDQLIIPKRIANATYFAHYFLFQGSPNGNDGAYMGLQEGSTTFWSRQARFSV